MAREAVQGIRCITCRKAQPAKSPKPGKPRDTVGQSNVIALSDLAYVKDANGDTHAYCIMLDEGTDWCVARYLERRKDTKTGDQVYALV